MTEHGFYIGIHRVAIIHQISDLKNEYPELYGDILEKLSEYNKILMNDAK